VAYINQDRKKTLAALAKAALAKWPGIRWTLRVRKPGTLIFTVAESNLDFAADLIDGGPYRERACAHLRDEGHVDVYHHDLARVWQGESLAFFAAAREALMTGNHDNSDAMSDYFDVGWYLSLQIGRWDKPCRFTFVRSSAELVERANAIASEMFGAANDRQVRLVGACG
jgi:hypothetical protein